MKQAKMLGFAALAASVLMTFVGARTASAAVLCKTPGTGEKTGTTCPEGWAYPAGTEIDSVSESNLALTTSEASTESTCRKGTFKGTTNNEGGATETVMGSVSAANLTWSECSTPQGACTMSTVKGGTLEIHWIEGSHNGTLTSNGLEITQSCASIFGNIHCFYEPATEHLGVITGGNPATIDIESTPINILSTSFLCPSEPKWDAKYEITTPKPLYVAGHT